MKYIRTKDGIFESEKVSHDDKYVYKYEVRPIWCVNQEQKEILKQADTIEELVDEYVLGETKYHKPCVTKLPLDFLKECVATKTHYELVVYGSIWVDGNLVKVAKMNEKGELELL